MPVDRERRTVWHWMNDSLALDRLTRFGVLAILILSLVPLCFAVLSSSALGPALWSPYPLLQVALPRWLRPILAPGSFLLLSVAVMLGWIRTVFWVLAVVGSAVSLLSGIYLWFALPGGLEQQGFVHCLSVVLMNLVVLLAFWVGWFRWGQDADARRVILLNLILTCWLFGVAFPYLGEAI